MPPASFRFTPGPPSGTQLPNWPWKYVVGLSFSDVRIEGSSANRPVPRLLVKLPLGMKVRNWKATWSISQSNRSDLMPKFTSPKPAWVGA